MLKLDSRLGFDYDPQEVGYEFIRNTLASFRNDWDKGEAVEEDRCGCR